MQRSATFLRNASFGLEKSSGRSRSFSVDLRAISRAVNRQVNFIAAVESGQSDLNYVEKAYRGDRIYKMAARHLGVDPDELFAIEATKRTGKRPDLRSTVKHVYAEGMSSTRTDSDIWLGYSRFSSFFTIEWNGMILSNHERSDQSEAKGAATAGFSQREPGEFSIGGRNGDQNGLAGGMNVHPEVHNGHPMEPTHSIHQANDAYGGMGRLSSGDNGRPGRREPPNSINQPKGSLTVTILDSRHSIEDHSRHPKRRVLDSSGFADPRARKRLKEVTPRHLILSSKKLNGMVSMNDDQNGHDGVRNDDHNGHHGDTMDIQSPISATNGSVDTHEGGTTNGSGGEHGSIGAPDGSTEAPDSLRSHYLHAPSATLQSSAHSPLTPYSAFAPPQPPGGAKRSLSSERMPLSTDGMNGYMRLNDQSLHPPVTIHPFSTDYRDGHPLHLASEAPQPCDGYTVFVYPYRRATSREIVETLDRYKDVLSPMDIESLIYLSGNTGSTRLFRFINKLLTLKDGASTTPIHRVEDHAWPWMTSSKAKEIEDTKLFLLLDALGAASISRYTFDKETAMYEYVLDGITALSNKIKAVTDGPSQATVMESGDYASSWKEPPSSRDDIDGDSMVTRMGDQDGVMMTIQSPISATNDTVGTFGDGNLEAPSATFQSPFKELAPLDTFILHKITRILILKRNFSQLNSDHIRVFSDYICDRLHRLHPKCIANIAFAIGHSKNLDEFWMFMMSKHIEATISQYDADDVTAIADAYASAGLEDHTFYEALCMQIKERFKEYNVHHLAIILRSLAKVRVRDEELLNVAMRNLDRYAETGAQRFFYRYSPRVMASSPGGRNGSLGGAHNGSLGVSMECTDDHHADTLRSPGPLDDHHTDVQPPLAPKERYMRIKRDSEESYTGNVIEQLFEVEPKSRTSGAAHQPVDPYVIATTIISARDLSYTNGNLDNFWKVAIMNLQRAKLDAFAANWLPIAAITFMSKVALSHFLPVWIRHVKYTIAKMRVKSQITTMKRRHFLLKRIFELGIVPSEYITPHTLKELDEICQDVVVTSDGTYRPESSTFHLEVSASLRALEIEHQREVNISMFVLDISIPQHVSLMILSSPPSSRVSIMATTPSGG